MLLVDLTINNEKWVQTTANLLQYHPYSLVKTTSLHRKTFSVDFFQTETQRQTVKKSFKKN